MNKKNVIQITVFLLIAQVTFAQSLVKYSGNMNKITEERRVNAEILVDSIDAKHLYAVGTVENLRGEIMVWNSRPFVAAITDEKKPYVEKNVRNLKAIFLVYADVTFWDTIMLTPKIRSMTELQKVIGKAAFLHGTDTASAFPFLLFGKIKKGSGHIMFKDPSVTSITPGALKGAKHIHMIGSRKAQMLGFYLQHHRTIFPQHERLLHIHYRLQNKYQAGHLDMVSFDESEPLKLLLPHL